MGPGVSVQDGWGRGGGLVQGEARVRGPCMVRV